MRLGSWHSTSFRFCFQELKQSQVHEVTALLGNHPAFYLITNDPLGLEKVRVAEAIDEFLKV
jgi:hypothetical protein